MESGYDFSAGTGMGKEIKNIRNRISIPAGCHERFLRLDHLSATGLTELGLCFSGISRLKRGYEIAYEAPPNHMLIATGAGVGWFRCGPLEWELKPNTLLLTPPGEPLAFGV